jgi:hypothetical protein
VLPSLTLTEFRRGAWCACGLAAAILLGCSAGPVAASSRYDPSLHFRSLTTPHFVIHFHRGEERLAVRLAAIAEQVHGRLTARLKHTPRGRTHVVFVDQGDQAMGWATPTPRNTIELSAVWPHPTEAIGNTDDWLTLVFTHEYAHILHVGQSEAWAAAARRVFGGVPFAFPNLYLPQWQIEGLATYEESRLTGRGRLFGGDFRMLVDEEARTASFEPIDRVNGGLVDWPSGTAGYAYGAYFHEYLASRFGEVRFGELARRTAGQVPYTGGRAFARVFGESLGDLWRGFAKQRQDATGETGTGRPSATRLTHHGFVVVGPRFFERLASGGDSARTMNRSRVVYSVRNPDGFPSLLSVGLDGSSPVRIADRFGGDRVSVAADAIYFDQLELRANVALGSDLYRLDRVTGRVDRLTRGARLSEPDVSPAGSSLVCIAIHPDRRDLARFDLADHRVRIILSQADTQFSTPRWSPDGRSIAVARQSLRGASEIVVVDAHTGVVRVMASLTRARHVTPVWTPDGRTILFAADRDGRFNVYAVDLDGRVQNPDAPARTVWRVTRLSGGATEPDISADGRTIVYVGYTPGGFDLFTIPFDRSAWDSVTEQDPQEGESARSSESSAFDGPMPPAAAASAYQPLKTLLPYYWLPRIETDANATRCGFSTGGADVLVRHSYSVSAAWPICGRSERDLPGHPDWSAAYVYDRWLPVFFAAASGEISSAAFPGDPASSAPRRVWRERRAVSAGMSLPFRRVRFSHSWLSAFTYERDAFDERAAATRHRPALQLGWRFTNAREYGYSIGPERGLIAVVTTEHVRRALGASGNAGAVTAQIRAYLPIGPPHAVLAIRTGAATSSGNERVRRAFELGGDGPSQAVPDFGGGLLSLMRGFPRGAFSGWHLGLVNLDYRVPLMRPERGRGILPIFLRTFYGSAFVDIGDAWNRHFAGRDLKTSVGFELSCDLVLGYSFPLTVTSGLAWGRDGHTGVDRMAPFVRVGRAF